MIRSCEDQFSVKVLKQKWIYAGLQECRALDLPLRQRVLSRQVILFCGEKPVVFAESMIPIDTLKGEHKRLQYLRNKPLGKYLFAKVNLQRTAMEWAQIKPGTVLYRSIQSHCELHDNIWGRRSLFNLNTKKILVSEFFLPHIQNLRSN